MFDLTNATKTMVNYCEEGDLMSALSYFEGEIRPVLTSMDSYENQQLLDYMKNILEAIDNEEWQTGLEIVDKVSVLLNES
jgi:hypothetical protein